MDLETENRLASLLMEEARRLRAQADKEGVQVYLRQPNVRGRPNSRFLTATVLGVEQANRAVEVNEMWRAREKELELAKKLKSRSKDENINCNEKKYHGNDLHSFSSSSYREEGNYCSSSKRDRAEDNYSREDGGLRDDEVEEFLHSRTKRGRGAIGSRMDEPGPYPSPATPLGRDDLGSSDSRVKEDWESRILGPAKPSFIKSHEQPPEEVCDAYSSKKHHSKEKKRPKEEGSERSKSKEKKKSKHHHHHKSRRRRRSDSE